MVGVKMTVLAPKSGAAVVAAECVGVGVALRCDLPVQAEASSRTPAARTALRTRGVAKPPNNPRLVATLVPERVIGGRGPQRLVIATCPGRA